MSDSRRFDFYARAAKGGDDECWPFLGARTTKGYGCYRFDGRQQMAHRVSYQLTRGAIPAGLLICHTCDNPPCVNPAHLFLGSYADNNRDASRKGRAAFGDRNGTRTHPEVVKRGGANPNAKLDEDAVRWIRVMYSLGSTQREIAEQFGIAQTVAGDAVTGRQWGHVNSPGPMLVRANYRSLRRQLPKGKR